MPVVTRIAPLAAAAVTIVVWASAFVAIRVALPAFDYLSLALARLLVASLVLVMMAPLFGVRRPGRDVLVRIAGCGVTGMASYQLLLGAGERTVPAGTASLLVNTGPIFASLFGMLLLRERLHSWGWLGMGVGFTGAAMIAAAGGDLRFGVDGLLVLGAAVVQALFFVLQKPLLRRYTSAEVTCYTTWAGTAFLMPFVYRVPVDVSHAPPAAVTAVLFLGLFSSAIGFVCWAYTLSRLEIGKATPMLYLVPVVAVGLGWLLLGERPTAVSLLGGALALIGVALTRIRQTAAEERRERVGARRA